jgi:hypothetical protein
MKRNYVEAAYLMVSAACRAGRKAAFIVGAVAAIGGALLLTACNEDPAPDGNNGISGTFTPPDTAGLGTFVPTAGANETTIKDWISEANAKIKAAQKLVIVYESTDVYSNQTEIRSEEDRFDAAAKKYIGLWYTKTTNEEGFEHEDGNAGKKYAYSGYAGDTKTMEYVLKRPFTNADKRYRYNNDVVQDIEECTVKVEGGKILVTKKSDYDSTTYEIVLAADKRYKTVLERRSSSFGSSTQNQVFSYPAVVNAGLPNGFSESQFRDDRTSGYKSVIVKWGAPNGSDLGQNTFWAGGESIKEIEEFAPDVDGKVIDKLKVGNTEYGYNGGNYISNIPVTEGMTIEAVWRNK